MNETRVALISIIVEDIEKTDELNKILHKYKEYIIGRMGIPYKEKNISVISIAVDAPQDETNALTGKLGRIDGISTKTTFSNH